MKIQFQRSGGFAGIRLAGHIDESTLSESDRAELQRLLSEVDLSAAAEASMRAMGSRPQPDRFHYRLVIEGDNGEEQSLNVDEAAMPPALEPLVSFLMDQLRKSRSGS